MARQRGQKGRGEVEKLPNGTWRARVTRTVVVGGEKKRARASKVFGTRREAWDWLDAQGRAGPVAAQTVGEWLDAWLPLQKARVSAASFSVDAAQARALRAGLGPLRLRDLDAVTIERWLARLREEGASDDAIQRAGHTLGKSLNAAVRLKVLPANPMTGSVRLPTPQRVEKKVMTAVELQTVIAAADRVGLGYAFRLWADAGLRPGEMFALDWADIDLAAGAVTVKRAMDKITNKSKATKTAKSRRVIPLAPSTVAALAAARPSAGGLVLPDSRGGHFWAANFARRVADPIFQAAGLEGRGFDRYTFRHTMASLLLSSGVSLLVVSRRLGHARASMTLDVYSHLMPNDAGKAATAMEGILSPAPR